MSGEFVRSDAGRVLVHHGDHGAVRRLNSAVVPGNSIPFVDSRVKAFPVREHGASPVKSNGELGLLFYKQGERRSVTVQEIFLADGADFAVAEKSGESNRAELFFNRLGIVVRVSKKILAATVATAEAPAVNSRVGELFFCAGQQFIHVLGRRRRVAPLELHGLSRARHRADGQHAGVWVAAYKIAHEKIAAMKIFEIFVDDKADE